MLAPKAVQAWHPVFPGGGKSHRACEPNALPGKSAAALLRIQQTLTGLIDGNADHAPKHDI
jgi:hypothetical protein